MDLADRLADLLGVLEKPGPRVVIDLLCRGFSVKHQGNVRAHRQEELLGRADRRGGLVVIGDAFWLQARGGLLLGVVAEKRFDRAASKSLGDQGLRGGLQTFSV